jgi:hypothetical protein
MIHARAGITSVATAAALALGAVGTAGCYEDALTPDPGGTPVEALLTDGPFPFDLVERVEVYVTSVAASTTADTLPALQQWVPLVVPERRFDLLALQQGATASLGEGHLPMGVYRAVQLTIDGDSCRVVLRDGRAAKVRWPALGRFAVQAMVDQPVTIAESGVRIVVDVDVGRSFVPNVDPLFDFVFVPFVRAVTERETGALAGMVWGDADGDGVPEPLPNASVVVYRGDPAQLAATWLLSATGHTDADGRYAVAFLPAGTYIVEVAAPWSAVLGVSSVPDIVIRAGAQTGHSVTLPRIGTAPPPAAVSVVHREGSLP